MINSGPVKKGPNFFLKKIVQKYFVSVIFNIFTN